MKNLFKVMSLSLVLASPLTFGQIAMAQELIEPDTKTEYRLLLTEVSEPQPAGIVAQRPEDLWNAYAGSGYSYWDAVVLAQFWGQNVSDAKDSIGNKMLGGFEGKLMLELAVTDARSKALGSAGDLYHFHKSSFNYKDAEAMAEFWGDPSPYDGKLRIERNLIMGNPQVVRGVMQAIHDR